MKKKDVLFLCQFFYPEYVSSATLPYDTAVALTKAGYTVDALCGYPKEYTEETSLPLDETHEGIRIHRVPYWQMNRKRKLGRLVNYFSFTIAILLHFFEMAQYRSVIVYSNPPILPWVAFLAKKIWKCKLIFVAYDLYPEIAIQTNSARETGMIARVMRHINQRVYSHADRVVALSSEMADFIAENRPIETNHVTVIPNWYADEGELETITPANRFYQDSQGRFIVSYFGNMGIMQDLDTLLGAIRLLQQEDDILFIFAGHGNKLDALRGAVATEHLKNVKILNFLHGQDFKDALAVSGCAVVSLVEGTTGLCVPSKTYSYMMWGIPLLVIMDESDIVRDVKAGAGIQFRNGDSEGMAAAIRSMRDHPELIQNMRTTCRKIYLENYTTEIATGQYVKMFQELLS